MPRQSCTQALIQQAFLVVHDVAVIFRTGGAVEEAGGRHLLWIAGNNQLPAARDGTHGVPGSNLRGFVEDHQVKQRSIRRQVLRNGEGAHQQARGQRRKRRAHLRHQLAQRLVSLGKLQLVVQGGKAGWQLWVNLG